MQSRQLVPVAPVPANVRELEKGVKKATAFGTMVLYLVCAGIAAWISLVPLASAVVTQGQLVVAGNRKQVQHRDGGVVSQILVRDGSVVEVGAVLLRLETEEASTSADLTRQKLRATDEQLALINEEMDIVRTLFKQGYASKRRYLNVKVRAAEVTGRRTQDQLQLRVAERAIRNAEIRSPAAGTVVGMQAHTVGGVIGAGETVLEIVPGADQLIVEAQVRPTDVDDVKLDLDAQIRFSSFKQRTTPLFNGRVIYISADVLEDKITGDQYYRCLVRIDKAELAKAGNLRLQPGMPAEVIIETSPRTVLTYLIQPLLDSTNRAMREK